MSLRHAAIGDKRAFTLIELLVVISIISLLVSILLPSLSTARDLARQVTCASNVRSVGMGLQLYMEDSAQELPLYWVTATSKWSTWNALMAEYVGGEYNQDGLAIFKCPSDQRSSTWSTCPNLPTQAMNAYLSKDWRGTGISMNNIKTPEQKILITEAVIPGSTSSVRVINPSVTSFYYPSGSETTILANLHGESNSNNTLFVDWHVELKNIDDTLDMAQMPGIWLPWVQ